jgi:hypothetical protein
MMVNEFFATYVTGPFLALLPRRWRQRLPKAEAVDWERAAAISGILEMLLALVALGNWYLFVLPQMYGISFDAATRASSDDTITDYHVRGAAWILFMLQPLTWLLLYFFLEGAVRFCGGAFAENVLGTLPLAIVDRILFWRTYRDKERVAGEWKSYVGSVREWMMVARLPDVADESRYGPEEEVLEIWASRRKDGWEAPRIVRVDETYYRLEEGFVESGERPFHYRLRKLAAGVMGRSVILYRSEGKE